MKPRRRLWLPSNYHHVTSRGNRKDAIFKSYADYLKFISILKEARLKFSIEICSYCLMSNHYHLQIYSPVVPLSKVMAYINKVYCNYFNRKYELTGHLYGGRFSSRPVYDGRGNLILSRYIHYNPSKANIVKSPEDYRWSSYAYYLPNKNKNLPSFLTLNPILDQFKGTLPEKKHQYIQWCKLKNMNKFDDMDMHKDIYVDEEMYDLENVPQE